MMHTVLLNCPVKAEIRAVDSQSNLTICYSYDYVLNLPNGQVTSFGELKSQDNCLKIFFFGLDEMTFGLVHTCMCSYSLPKWQAVKLTFFAPVD